MPAVPLGKYSALQSNFPALAEKYAGHGISVAIWFRIQATVLLSYPSLGYQPTVNPRKWRRQAGGRGGSPDFVCGSFWKQSKDTAGFCLLRADSRWVAQHCVAALRRLQKQPEGKLQKCTLWAGAVQTLGLLHSGLWLQTQQCLCITEMQNRGDQLVSGVLLFVRFLLTGQHLTYTVAAKSRPSTQWITLELILCKLHDKLN